MKVKILNLQGGNSDGFTKGIRYEDLRALEIELLEYLERGKTKKCWVIQKDENIKTTILYFDLDDTTQPFKPAYDFILKYLSTFYSAHLLDSLVFKNKSAEKYHIYFPNVFVSETSLKKIVKNINKEFGKKLVDERCIKNFIKFEGFQKCKNGKFIENSNYEMIADENSSILSISDCYGAIYDFNKPETDTKISWPKVSEKNWNKPESKQYENNQVFSDTPDKLSQVCNDMFETNFQWSLERNNQNSFLLQHDSYTCLIDSNHNHSQKNHSCVFVNKFGKSVIHCHSHGKQILSKNQNLTNLKQYLGLCKRVDNMSDLQLLIYHIKKVGLENGYKKTTSEYILKPNANIPVLYEPLYTFNEFINAIFNDNPELLTMYEKHPNNHDNLIKYLKKYNPVELPFIQYNRYIYAFDNGYLDISNLYDIKFSNYSTHTDVATSIYYPLDFDTSLLLKNVDDIKTPIFDKICMNHFQRESESQDIYDCFLGMIGRLHYPTHTYDRFNCSMFIKGGSNTGKSTTGGIIMSNHQNIGTIGSKLEDTFGLESFVNNGIVYCPDLPKNFSKKLDKSTFQRMIESECISVSRKNKEAINNYQWNKQMLFLGNYFPDYQDSSGAIPRRLCVFFMDCYIPQKDTTLQDRCKKSEGHLLLIKTLKAYRNLIQRFKNQTYEDWNVRYFREGRNELTSKVNNLYNFLSLAPKEFDYWCVYEEGSITVLKGRNNFQNIFQYYLKCSKADQKKWIKDTTTLERFGFEYKEKNVCGMCNRKANKKDCICSAGYNAQNLKKKACIVNLKIISAENFCEKCGSDKCRCGSEIK